MLQQIADFEAEAQELERLLSRLSAPDWQRTTQFKAWTINDVVLHLYYGDQLALASTEDATRFAALRGDVLDRRKRLGLSPIEETRQRFAGLAGSALLAAWSAQRQRLIAALAAKDPDARLPWAGPDMGVRMFTTARQMETWAHGQEIYDCLGLDRIEHDRLRNIATIGVRTFGWTFVNRGMAVPEPVPYVRLIAPSGATWEWNDPGSTASVRGSAVDFCRVVAQVRNIADTGLEIAGLSARQWMEIAQCFAGPPETPPAPGSRRKVSPPVPLAPPAPASA